MREKDEKSTLVMLADQLLKAGDFPVYNRMKAQNE